MTSATVSSAAPRYAPEDPSLPKPWKGLVDGKTGYLYFWNPETNVTQYERPVAQQKSSAPLSSSVQVQQSSQGQSRDNGYNDDGDRYSRGSNGGSKVTSGTRGYQSGKSGSDHSYNVPNGDIGAGHGASSGKGHGPSDVGNGPSAQSYRRRHEISVTGDNVPTPFASFEATGFPPEILREYVELLAPMEKHRRLEQILRSQEPGSKVIIFCSTKKMCDQLSRNLTRQFGAAAIHGDKSQGERDHVLNQFRTGRSPILVATDVAARGLDIKDIRVVINYDFPTGVEDYVHRIGRTGRAGATGLAYTFFSDQDAKHASDLIKILEGANQRVPPELRNVASRGGGMGRARRPWGSGSGGRDAGRGGRNDSGYGGRDGGRGSWGIPERGGGRGFDREPRDSDKYGRGFNDSVEGSGSYHNKSFHESMARAGGGARRSRSRSRSRSPNKVSGWGDHRSSKARSRSHSRSPVRYDRAPPARERSPLRSFRKPMTERSKSPPPPQHKRVSPYNNDPERVFKNSAGPASHPRERSRSPSDYHRRENVRGSDDGAPREWGKDTNGGQVGEAFPNGPRSSYLADEEEEEGMIPPE
ncbi:ATP-dependent RNA helicase-like protein [Actinidia chinensis var. chinensis]|uniref:RNA helicase n=1 Tax=Actinidia chinensis var. chinensis TaxID=1590841 RepID=A0A2R6RYY3_ACTCC|nr:ATP-dependent RNA helicase-like protein [Actinidia chinensis var. chinensis]